MNLQFSSAIGRQIHIESVAEILNETARKASIGALMFEREAITYAARVAQLVIGERPILRQSQWHFSAKHTNSRQHLRRF